MTRFLPILFFIVVICAFALSGVMLVKEHRDRNQIEYSKQAYTVWSKLNPQIEVTYDEWVVGKKIGLIK